MKIIDTFMFRDELDLLEFRLEYLYDYVDYFVLVESNVTHRGYPKTIFYSLYKDRFEKYQDKIIHVLSTDIPKVVSNTITKEDKDGRRKTPLTRTNLKVTTKRHPTSARETNVNAEAAVGE